MDKTPATLPDLLAEGLDILFVGINPSLYSARHGHYFARPGNRFWPCFSRSRLSAAARQALGAADLAPAHDRALLAHGFGFTDLVKRPTANASALSRQDLAQGAARLADLVGRHRPAIACFHGITAYRPLHRLLEGAEGDPALGLQPERIGATRLFLVPNPSGANAHFTRGEQISWYDALHRALGAA